MSVYLFTELFQLFLFLLMCGTLLCGHVCAKSIGPTTTTAKNSVKLFEKGNINDVLKPNEDQEAEIQAEPVNAENYYSPIFVSTNEVIFALAGVDRTKKQQKRYIDIITKYVENKKLLAQKDDLTALKWTSQFAVQHEVEENNNTYFVKGLLGVTTGEKVYLLLLNSTKNLLDSPTNFDWEFRFAVATIIKGQASVKQTKWTEHTINAENVIKKLKEEFKGAEATNFIFSGSAFLTEEKKIVFALVIENLKKKVSALIQLDDNKEEKIESETMYTNILENCQPYFFPWTKKVFMVPVNCGEDKNKIMELIDFGKEWSGTTKAFTHHYEFLKSKQNFVSIKNNTKEILLFTETKTLAAGQTINKDEKKINLWMSDGTRLKTVGIIADGGETITPISFLFTDGKLFSLNQQLDQNKIKSVTLKFLEQQSTKIISTINAWEDTNAEILKFCNGEDALKILCNTNGLVGFLSGTEEESGDGKWKDEYLYESAFVTPTESESNKKAEKVLHGFKFSGEGAGAKWPVGKTPEDQPYNFINPGFTLVATVTVGNGTNGERNSILGVDLGSTKKTARLWCTNDGKWEVNDGVASKKIEQPEIACKHGKKYYVVLFLRNGELFIYVNGQQLKGYDKKLIQNTNTENIENFYFGVNCDMEKLAATDVTITNVLLYNRPFTTDEAKKLKPKQNKADNQAILQGNGSTLPQNNVSTPQTDSTLDTSTTEETNGPETNNSPGTSATPTTTEKDGAEIKLCLFSINSVILFSLLFCPFTLLGRYVH